MIRKTLYFFALLLFLIILFFYFNVKDRHPGYTVDINIKGAASSQIRAGFAAIDISPTIYDKWHDNDGNSKYEPDKGDTYDDNNANDKFDPIWIAGFDNKRAANGIHDPLWSRTIVFDDGKTRIALTSIDAIGFMHDDVVDVRNLVSKDSHIDYSVISSTHTHEAPDLLGLWGDSYLKSGVNKQYMKALKEKIAASIDLAAQNLEEATLKFARNEKDALTVVNDTRKPIVYDEGIRLIQAISKQDGKTIGTLVSWADHPETLWDKNLLISSDFPHYLRTGIEKGVRNQDTIIAEGLGGITVFFNGAIGGLMTTNPSMEIEDMLTGTKYKTPGYDKAKAQGEYIAMLSLDALANSRMSVDTCGISIRAKSMDLKFKNKFYRIGAMLGVLDRGMNGWMQVRSEIAAFSIGPAHFITTPGEIYPELVNGGIEAPKGQDFEIEPVEVPHIRSQMKGDYNFVFGMANDMIGYIIPKSQWDEDSPFTYGNHDAPYGEVNSLGPETGPKIHSEISQLLEEFYE